MKLCLTIATSNFKWGKITHISLIFDKIFANLGVLNTHFISIDYLNDIDIKSYKYKKKIKCNMWNLYSYLILCHVKKMHYRVFKMVSNLSSQT